MPQNNLVFMTDSQIYENILFFCFITVEKCVVLTQHCWQHLKHSLV